MTLTLEFLGMYSVSRDGVPISHFRGDKVRGLLAYLATEADRPHRRASLAALLWPGRREEVALRNLSQTLLRLRSAVGDTTNPSPLLAITRGTIGWRGEAAGVDVLDFARLTYSIDPMDLEQAATIYRGEFLLGFDLPDAEPFEEWLLLARERLQQQALSALHNLTDHYLGSGQWTAAEDAARRAMTLDPWREVTHRQLMRALAGSGDRGGALAQYERCRAVLLEELGVEPDEATRALYARIRANDLVPPAQDPDAMRTRLPVSLTGFVGREDELRDLGDLLRQDSVRLVTLVGAGGMGKTRLAVEAARGAIDHFPDGAVFVPLAPLATADAIPATIAQAIGVTVHGSDLVAALLHFLRDQRLLLILDNMEHLPGGAALVVSILNAAPEVRIMVTSRERVLVRGAQVLGVDGLEYHTGVPHEGVTSPAARLFLQSARRGEAAAVIHGGDPLVAERIGALLGGMPLAIEMAAAWVGVLPLADIPGEIERSIDFLNADWADAPERQRSMRAVFEWSWRLLSDVERIALRRLSVFRGGCTREAAETVTGATLRVLADLSHASFLRWHPDDTTGRYQIHELLRQFAEEQIQAVPDERERVEAAHGAYYLAVAEAAAAEYSGPRQVTWLDRIERDHDNIRAAQERFSARGEVGLELRLVAASVYFWFIRGYHREGTERALHALAHPGAQAATEVRARALNGAGYLQWVRGYVREADTLFSESVRIARAVNADAILAFGLCYLGAVVNARREYATAEALLKESLQLWDALGDRANIGLALMFLGDSALGRHDQDGALAAFNQSADLFRATGNISVLPYPLRRLAHLALRDHDHDRATMLYMQSMTVNREVGDRQGIAASLVGLAAVAEARGQPERAARLLGLTEALVEELQTKLLPFDGVESERISEAVRAALDPATFAEAWANGRVMTWEQVVPVAIRPVNSI